MIGSMILKKAPSKVYAASRDYLITYPKLICTLAAGFLIYLFWGNMLSNEPKAIDGWLLWYAILFPLIWAGLVVRSYIYKYVVFCEDTLLRGQLITKWWLIFPKEYAYYQIEDVILITNWIRPLIFIKSAKFTFNFKYASGFKKESLKLFLEALLKKVPLWKFDDDAKKLIKELRIEVREE